MKINIQPQVKKEILGEWVFYQPTLIRFIDSNESEKSIIIERDENEIVVIFHSDNMMFCYKEEPTIEELIRDFLIIKVLYVVECSVEVKISFRN
jgi:hypothetical protein